ncbi:MAG: SHOCT domain-containing protein [Ruminococcus sp.]|nr:SHOCT domain-containing protein [Ruminococcus sp.]
MGFIYFFSVIVSSVICGFVSKTINENKGYYGGFAWGFWLSILGIIVVACKPENRSTYYSNNSDMDYALSSYATEKSNSRIISEGGWKCHSCNRVNASYVTTCICGLSKKDSEKQKEEISARQNVKSEADALARYKKMYDDGLITEEEYLAKRKQVLGI